MCGARRRSWYRMAAVMISFGRMGPVHVCKLHRGLVLDPSGGKGLLQMQVELERQHTDMCISHGGSAMITSNLSSVDAHCIR